MSVKYGNLKIRLAIFIGQCIIFPTLAILMSCSTNKVSEAKQSATRSLPPSPPQCSSDKAVLDVTTNQLIQLYRENPIVFDNKYKGKCIAVAGPVIEMTTTTGYVLTLYPFETKQYERQKYTYQSDDMRVAINIPKSGASDINQVKLKGPLVKFSGNLNYIVDGEYISVANAKLDPSFDHVTYYQDENIYDYAILISRLVRVNEERIASYTRCLSEISYDEGLAIWLANCGGEPLSSARGESEEDFKVPIYGVIQKSKDNINYLNSITPEVCKDGRGSSTCTVHQYY